MSIPPDTPSFASQPIRLSDTSISISFTLGYDGGSALTAIEYARGPDYQTWVSLPGMTSPVIVTVASPSTGNYRLRAVNDMWPSDQSSDGLVSATVPDAPSFASQPIRLSDTSISIDFTVGADDGGSPITAIEYAREGDYNSWTPISGLTSPVTITVASPSTGNYKLRTMNGVGYSPASAAGLVEATPPDMYVPSAPSFTAPPTILSDTSISI